MSQIGPLQYVTRAIVAAERTMSVIRSCQGVTAAERPESPVLGMTFLQDGTFLAGTYTLFLEARARQLEYLFYKNGTKFLGTEDVIQLFRAASYQYDSSSNTLAFIIPGDIPVKEDPEQEHCAAALSCGEKGTLTEHSSKGDASKTERVKACTGDITNNMLEKRAGVSHEHQGEPVAHAGVQTNMQDTRSSQSPRVTQDSQASVGNLEQYQVLPMLQDEQNKKSLQYRAEQTQQLSQSTGRPNCGNAHLLKDYQMQIMMLEQQNKKRLQLKRQAEEAQQGGKGISRPKQTANRALQDYQMQIMMLKQQNQKRLQLQRRAEGGAAGHQTQSRMPEAQNQNRLGTVHQEQEQTTMANNDAIPFEEEKFGPGEPMVPDTSVETDRMACPNLATQDTRPHASPSLSVENLTGISGAEVSESSNKPGDTEAADIEPDPRASSQSILCHFKPQKGQVRGAKVRPKIISLSDDDLQTSHESTDHSDDDPDESDDNLEAHDDARDSDTTQDTHTTAPSQNRSEKVPPHSGTGSETLRHGKTKRRQEEEEEEGDDDDGKKRKRQKASGSEKMAETSRLAYPYQAYERFRPCFKRSGSNPRGGCTDLRRLKFVNEIDYTIFLISTMGQTASQT
ncbi:hypothetical protein DL762_006410 [Monosporascus cannonballus]|uniref:Uncharacterized protein n=1 Tax=Monosporascus cannonballus TaxID=155416 RepID=A0ABY0H241_9PEZI|nr:hypothetical protein DL762_006410 [Monosporascus cannonballus]